VFIVVVCFVIDLVRKLLDTPLYILMMLDVLTTCTITTGTRKETTFRLPNLLLSMALDMLIYYDVSR